MRPKFKYGYLTVVGSILLMGCAQQNEPRVGEEPYPWLSQYHFFTGNLENLEPNPGVLPYDVITPLFSDYAEKARFVWMPEGRSASITQEEETFIFPQDAVLIKNFYYPKDVRDPGLGRQMIETRLLIRRSKGWEAWNYVWNNDQTDAQLEIAGDVKPVTWIDVRGQEQQVSFVIPNKNQCKGCHEYKKQLQPIGPKVRHLNKEFSYPEGTKNQLIKWQEAGYLRGLTGDITRYRTVSDWDDPQALLNERALAYLEINCGICHSEHGPAGISGLFLTTDRDNADQLGVCKSPVSAGSGSGGRNYDIVPGDPDKSILLYRMESLEPGEMMPELGRSVIHREGVALIRDWIDAMEGECPESL